MSAFFLSNITRSETSTVVAELFFDNKGRGMQRECAGISLLFALFIENQPNCFFFF